MADKLLIILANSNPLDVQQMLTPLSQAIAAAAMEYQVEIVFNGRCVELLRPGVAQALMLNDGRNIYDVIQDASASGVLLKVCTMAVEGEIEQIIPEIEERVGGTYLIGEAMDDATETFTY